MELKLSKSKPKLTKSELELQAIRKIKLESTLEEKNYTVRKNELARIISDKYPEYYIYEVQDMLVMLSEVIQECIAEGKNVHIENFGTFISKVNNDMYTKHPGTGVWQWFKGNLSMQFKSSRKLQDRLKKIKVKGSNA